MVRVCLSKHGNHQAKHLSPLAQSCLFTVGQLGRYDGPPSLPSLTELCGRAFPSGDFGGVISNLEGPSAAVSCVCKVRTSLPHGTARQFPVPATFQILREYFLSTASLSPALPCFRSPSVLTSHAHPSIELVLGDPASPFLSSPLPSPPSLRRMGIVGSEAGRRSRCRCNHSMEAIRHVFAPHAPIHTWSLVLISRSTASSSLHER